jgi:ATP synthase protein I
MDDNHHDNTPSFSAKIAAIEKRKLKVQGEKKGVWFGLGMFGMVGWSVAMPSLLGVFLGIWLDKSHPVPFSWTLSCLIVGLVAGCLIAWYWVSNEDKDIH